MKHFLLIVSLFLTIQATAQNGTEKVLTASGPKNDTGSKPVYNYVEQMPTSGYDYQKYLSEHIKYPAISRAEKIEGRVIVKFIVNDDGSISDCTVVRGLDSYCDAEALRVIRSMPPWKPARQNGKAVSVRYTMPVVFRMN